MIESDLLGNTKRTGVYIFNKSVLKRPIENVPKIWGQNLKKPPIGIQNHSREAK